MLALIGIVWKEDGRKLLLPNDDNIILHWQPSILVNNILLGDSSPFVYCLWFFVGGYLCATVA